MYINAIVPTFNDHTAYAAERNVALIIFYIWENH